MFICISPPSLMSVQPYFDEKRKQGEEEMYQVL